MSLNRVLLALNHRDGPDSVVVRLDRGRKGRSRSLGLLALIAVLLSGVTGCAKSEGPRDAAGMTQAEVQQLGVQGQFELVGERVERMYELLTEAQLQISDGLWKRGYHGLLPHAQPNEWSTPGMTDENSYNVATFSALFPEGATGDPADLEPMIGFFKEKGWPIETTRHGTEIQGLTHDGFVVSWRVQANGQYNMKVESQTFWGDVAQLRREIGLRVPPRSLDMSDTAPGEYVPDFPSWDDPAIYEVDLLNHWRIYEEEAAEAEQFRDSEESVEAEGESTLAPGDPAPTP